MKFPLNLSPTARGALSGAAAVGLAGFNLYDIYEKWPEGDPDKAREAAVIWRSIAQAVRESAGDVQPRVTRVWRDHPSAGSEAFRAFWEGGLFSSVLPPGAQGPNPSFSFQDYAKAVAEHAEHAAEACEEFGRALDAIRHTLEVMAATALAQSALAGAWPWVGGPGSAAVKWVAERLRRRYQLEYLMLLLEKYINDILRKLMTKKLAGKMVAERVVANKAAEYAAGSAFFAGADTTLAVGTRLSFGDGFGPGKDNATATMKDFAACLVFFGVWDLTRLGPLGKALDNDLGDFASFYIGSNAYTVANNAMSGKDLGHMAPSMDQLISKVLTGSVQQGKLPDRSPSQK
ncbi:hypothetical protein ACQPYK_39225 [Streptosporangium sp. CA-135522]|uniref:WXG100-like domain-containing protein n=1 Tax=Streptosporangium sp. CA-135522 TaxID=3240072 RepID=UPI003D8FBB4C